MSKSSIEWTEETWNPITGCTKVSAGCKNCYAERMAIRQAHMECARLPRNANALKYLPIVSFEDGGWSGGTNFIESALSIPLKRKKATMYFVCSMSDLFHESVPFEWIDKVFAVMALCPQHTFQVLTKRPERMAEYLNFIKGESSDGPGGYPVQDHFSDVFLDSKYYMEKATALEKDDLKYHHADGRDTPGYDDFYDEIIKKIEAIQWPLPNVWLGTTCENQEMADERIPHLLKCPAAKRFVSIEPMLGAVDIVPYIGGNAYKCKCEKAWHHTENNRLTPHGSKMFCLYCETHVEIFPTLDWVICGGESGSGARPMHPDWAKSIRDQCRAAGVPFFFKQWGAWRPERSGDIDSPSETRHVMYKADWNEKEGMRAVCDPSNPDPTKPLSENMTRVGKKKAGSLLDGVEYKEMPG